MKRPHEYIVTGGGSGGHIIPALSVAAEIKKADPNAHIRYILDRQSTYRQTVERHASIDVVHVVFAGKLRRYHGIPIWRQLLDVPTVFRNARDIIYLLIGFMQSIWLLITHRPRVVFVKGGFVGVPVGLAAALLRVPYVTHDSDIVPGLANRLIARWARVHAVGMPGKNYAYDPQKTVEVGVPIDDDRFAYVTTEQQRAHKRTLGIPESAVVVLVVGGGGGSRSIDTLMEGIAADVLNKLPHVHIIHVFGKLNEHLIGVRYSKLTDEQASRVYKIGYTDELEKYSAAADVIVTRAGATNMAEFAAQARACVIIPAAHLAGGHQVKNAQVFARDGAAIVLDESGLVKDPAKLSSAILHLASDGQARYALAHKLHSTVRLHAAQKIVQLLMDHAE